MHGRKDDIKLNSTDKCWNQRPVVYTGVKRYSDMENFKV
jgi:hypothetical protein